MDGKSGIWVLVVTVLAAAVIVLGFVVIGNQQTITSLHQRVVSLEQKLVAIDSDEAAVAARSEGHRELAAREDNHQVSALDRLQDSQEPLVQRVEGFRGSAFGDVEYLRDPNVPAEEKLTRARSLLQSAFPPVRMLAINTLVEQGDPEALSAIRDFIASVGDDRMSRRMAEGAIDMLADLDGNGADTLLYDFLDLEREDLAIRAASVLEKRGDSGPIDTMVEAYSARLDDFDGGVRSRAVQSLGSMRSAAAIPALQVAITDTNSEVRMRTAQALGRTGSEDAVEYLMPLLDDPVQEVRESASRSLDQIRNPRQQSLPFFRS